MSKPQMLNPAYFYVRISEINPLSDVRTELRQARRRMLQSNQR